MSAHALRSFFTKTQIKDPLIVLFFCRKKNKTPERLLRHCSISELPSFLASLGAATPELNYKKDNSQGVLPAWWIASKWYVGVISTWCIPGPSHPRHQPYPALSHRRVNRAWWMSFNSCLSLWKAQVKIIIWTRRSRERRKWRDTDRDAEYFWQKLLIMCPRYCSLLKRTSIDAKVIGMH